MYLSLLLAALTFAHFVYLNSESQKNGSAPKELAAQNKQKIVEGKEKKEEVATQKEKTKLDENLSPVQRYSIETIANSGLEAQNLEDTTKAIQLQTIVADVLWGYKEAQSRDFLIKAFDLATQYYKTKKENTPSARKGLSLEKPDLRLEVISVASKHDRKLGRQFIDQYVEDKKREREEKRKQSGQQNRYDPAFGDINEASNDLLHTAESLLEADKKSALDLARQSLSGGIPQGMAYLIAQIAERDREMADQLYLFALDRLQQEKVPVPGQLLLLSSYPFGIGNVWISSGKTMNSYSFPVSEKFTADDKIIQQFIGTASIILQRTAETDWSQFADAQSRVGAALFAAKLLQPRIAQYRPALLEKWYEISNTLFAITDIENRIAVNKSVNQITTQLLNRETPANEPQKAEDQISSLLDRAQKATDLNKRDDFFRRAALIASSRGDIARAMEISNRIGNIEYRKKVQARINYTAAKIAIRDKRLDEASKYAVEVTPIDQSALLLIEIARVALEDKDNSMVFSLLSKAEKRVTVENDTPEKLRALTSLVNLNIKVDLEHSFDLASQVIKTANNLPDYSPDQPALESSFTNASGEVISLAIDSPEEFDLWKALSALAKSDFWRTISLAESINKKPTKLVALVKVASCTIGKKNSKTDE